jgi:cation diffusion facilitator family transporter
VYAALFGNFTIAVFKFIAATITMSSAMLAEAYHSVSDTLNQVFLLVGIKMSKRKPDELHQFGYAKEQYFWSFIVAVILFSVAGILSVREGYSKLMEPHPIRHVYWSYAAIFIGIILDGYAMLLAYRQIKAKMIEDKLPNLWQALKHSKNPTVLTVFVEDSMAVIGLMIALIGITLAYFTGNMIYDAISSMLIGIMLMSFALMLGYEVKKLIIGESVSFRKKKKIRAAIESFDEVDRVLSLKTMHLSEDVVIVGMEIKFNPNIKVRELEKINDRIEQKVMNIIPKAKCYIEAENKKSI